MADQQDEKIYPAEFRELSVEKPRPSSRKWADRSLELVKDLKVNVTARLGTATISVSRLFELKDGETVALETGPDEPIDLLVEGKPVARGHIVVVGESFGVRISEVLDSDG